MKTALAVAMAGLLSLTLAPVAFVAAADAPKQDERKEEAKREAKEAVKKPVNPCAPRAKK